MQLIPSRTQDKCELTLHSQCSVTLTHTALNAAGEQRRKLLMAQQKKKQSAERSKPYKSCANNTAGIKNAKHLPFFRLRRLQPMRSRRELTRRIARSPLSSKMLVGANVDK